MEVIMKKYIFFLFSVFFSCICFAQNNNDANPNSYNNFGLSALLGYNFNGSSDWSNLSPDLFLGWDENIVGYKNAGFSLNLRVGPTISSPGNIKDSSNYFRALMLPGNASFSALLYPTYSIDKFKILVVLAGGLKVLSGLKDSSVVISQHNVRLGIGFQWDKLFSASFQYTFGWHDLTTESEKNYTKIFNQSNSAIKYIMINLQTYLPPLQLYLYGSWRKLLDYDKFKNFDGDSKIITIGIKKDIDLIPTFSAR